MDAPTTHLLHLPASHGPVVLVHGGAGVDEATLEPERRQAALAGLRAAVEAGRAVLDRGGSAVDAVCASVVVMEDAEVFNAGRGAALTLEGTAELDACLMAGDARAGAVACARGVRNPVLAARAVMERSPHVLIASPTARLLRGWGVELVDEDHHRTPYRQAQLKASGGFQEYLHGTVGAVAVDADGAVAAATSTGGITAQLPGRVGDTPLVGCGTWADERSVAVSCTGQGEAFIRGALAHEVHARLRWGRQSLDEAVRGSLDELVGARGFDGGLIAVRPDGEAVLAFDSPGMFRGWDDGRGPGLGIGPAPVQSQMISSVGA